LWWAIIRLILQKPLLSELHGAFSTDYLLIICFNYLSRNEPFLYESGWRDGPAVFFYTLICIIMHAILQEYVLDVSWIDLILMSLFAKKKRSTGFKFFMTLNVFYLSL
jgi:hypothetical protein